MDFQLERAIKDYVRTPCEGPEHKKYFSTELDPAHSRRLPRSLRAPQIYQFYPDTVDFGLNAASRLEADTLPVTGAQVCVVM